MITDSLKNIENYNIPIEAVNFIKNLSQEIPLGKYSITNDIYANVESYKTKFDGKFESHKEYVDIQILLKGSERIYYTDINSLNENPNYDDKKDISFYTSSIKDSNFVTLNGANFMLIFPHEAHAPQVLDIKEMNVKKVVVKIKKSLFF